MKKAPEIGGLPLREVKGEAYSPSAQARKQSEDS